MATYPMIRRDALKLTAAATVLSALPEIAFAADKQTVLEEMAHWLVALRYEDIPPNVVERAKRVVLDTLGCALGAVNADPVRIARLAVALEGGNPQATIVGVGAKVASDQAAFLNGMAIRYLDYND